MPLSYGDILDMVCLAGRGDYIIDVQSSSLPYFASLISSCVPHETILSRYDSKMCCSIIKTVHKQ